MASSEHISEGSREGVRTRWSRQTNIESSDSEPLACVGHARQMLMPWGLALSVHHHPSPRSKWVGRHIGRNAGATMCVSAWVRFDSAALSINQNRLSNEVQNLRLSLQHRGQAKHRGHTLKHAHADGECVPSQREHLARSDPVVKAMPQEITHKRRTQTQPRHERRRGHVWEHDHHSQVFKQQTHLCLQNHETDMIQHS